MAIEGLDRTELTGHLVLRALGGAKQKLKVCSLLPELPELVTQLAVVLFLFHLEISCIPMHASRHVFQKVVKHKLGLLLCGSDKGHCIG